MIAASLFSGIGAPEQAMPSWHWAWHAEVAPFPAAVLAHRHPQSVNLGDVSAHDFVDRAAAVVRPDVLVFGSPCQSFSVAGRRLGLDDPRGNLALVALGIVARLRPRWFVFENVPGLLSSAGGRDFGLFLRSVDDIGYSGAWAVLDAQHFGVAQRRRRVFLVGHVGDWRGPAAVLLEPPGLRGHSPPRHRAGQTVASGLGAGSQRSGQRVGRREAAVNQPIAFDETQITSPENRCNPQPGDPSHPLAAGARPPTRQDPDSGLVTHPLDTKGNSTGVCLPILESGKRTGASTSDQKAGAGIGEPGDPMFSLGTDSRHAVAFTSKDHGQDAGDLAPTLRAMPGRHANGGGQVAVAYGFEERHRGDDGRGHEREPSFSAELAPTMGTIKPPAVAYGGNNTAGPIDLATALTAHGGSHGRLDFESETFVVASHVRRLTPRECERLQGFPDDHTLVPLPLKRRQTRVRWSSDGPRYKAIGNSMAVPCVRWILERIDAVDRIMTEHAA